MQPFLKWAGGKRWLEKQFPFSAENFTGRYIEPFVGSGAMFFALEPRSAILTDVNFRLIETYQAIASRPDLVRRYLGRYQSGHSTESYYRIRSTNYRSSYMRAAQFLYLNRTCWNGLYRVNRKGIFNVPKGTKDAVILPDDDFAGWSNLLAGCEIYTSDFEAVIDRARNGDLVYCDPPYTVHHNQNGFLKYNENIFSWNDQERLRLALDRAISRGVTVVVSNADHKSINELYEGFGEKISLDRASVISGKASGRGRYREVMMVNRAAT